MSRLLLPVFLSLSFSVFTVSAADEASVKKSYLEDIFIWKMSDELKLTAKEEKQFTDISKSLNKRKADLNRQIQDAIHGLQSDKAGEKTLEEDLRRYKKLLQEYNQVSITEYDSVKRLLGPQKFVSYLKIKNDLTSKVKSILIGDKGPERRETGARLPSPKVIVEGAD